MYSSPAGGATARPKRKLALPAGASIVGIVGNPKPRSRTHRMVTAVAEALASASGGRVENVIDLADLRAWVFEFGAPQLAPILEQTFQAEVLVVGSPVFKATYTGLLKAFCDHIAQGQLAGTLAIPAMMGGAPQHALAVDLQLRPLLVELGATCASPGLYVLEAQLDEIETIARQYVERLAASIDLQR